jgi:hypothetical protein
MKTLLVITFLFVIIALVKSRTIYTVAGNGINWYSGDGGPAIDAELSEPYQVSLVSNGGFYIADTDDYVIRWVNASNIIFTVIGNGGQGYAGDGGPAANCLLNTPYGVWATPSGVIYVADTLNNVIRIVTTDGIINTFAGTGSPGYSGDGGPAKYAKFNQPYALFITPDNEMYIADSGNNVVRMIYNDNVTTVAGIGVAGYSGDGGPATEAKLNLPTQIAVSSDAEIYIADSNNNVVRLVNSSGYIGTFAGTGASGFAGDGGPATKAQLRNPNGVALSPTGNVYIGDTGNNRVRIVYTNGTIETFAGTGAQGYTGNGVSALNASFFSPTFLTVSPYDEVYISDTGNSVIRRVCNSSYTGFFCQHPICYGVNATSPNVCSRRGSCIAFNTCSCNNGFSGPQCEQGSGAASISSTNLQFFAVLVLILLNLLYSQ